MYQHNQFIGNVGKKPEMKFTPSGQAITKFSIAVNHEYTKADGQKVKETMWVSVSAWGKLAEVVNQYVDKGSKVQVVGRFTPDLSTGGPRIWTDKEGKPHASYELTAASVLFLSDKKSGAEVDAELNTDFPAF